MNRPTKEDRQVCPGCNTCHARPHCEERDYIGEMIDEEHERDARRLYGGGVRHELLMKGGEHVQLDAFDKGDPWTEDDCGILAGIDDGMFAELFLGDQVSAATFAQCRHISGKHWWMNVDEDRTDEQRRKSWKLKHTLWAFRGADTEEGEAHKAKLQRTKSAIVGVSKGVVLGLVALAMSGCVTYVEHFKPNEPAQLCVNIAKCTVLQ